MALIRVKHVNNPGEYIVIDEENFDPEAMTRLEGEVVENEVPEIAEEAESEAGGGQERNRSEAIANAINSLSAEESNWTKQGKPALGALSEILGFSITAEERDAVWDPMQG